MGERLESIGHGVEATKLWEVVSCSGSRSAVTDWAYGTSQAVAVHKKVQQHHGLGPIWRRG